MSHASLKEQLQAMVSPLPESTKEQFKEEKVKENKHNQGKKNYVLPKAKPQKPKWLEYVQYGVELLKVYFPACFGPINSIKPLKKGIKQDLIKRLSGISEIVTEDKACMVKSLAYYVNTALYHKSVVEGAVRIDLDGNPDGFVSKEEAQYSFDRYRAKLQAKSQAPDVSTKQNKKNYSTSQPSELEPQ